MWASEQQIALGGNNIGAMPGLKGNAMERIIAGRFQTKGDADIGVVGGAVVGGVIGDQVDRDRRY